MLRLRFIDEHLHAAVEIGADQHVSAALLALLGHRIGDRGGVLHTGASREKKHIFYLKEFNINIYILFRAYGDDTGSRNIILFVLRLDDRLRIGSEYRARDGCVVRLDSLPKVAAIATHLPKWTNHKFQFFTSIKVVMTERERDY